SQRLDGVRNFETEAVQPVLPDEHSVAGERLLERDSVEAAVHSCAGDHVLVDVGEVRELGHVLFDVPEETGGQSRADRGHDQLVERGDVGDRSRGERGVDLLLLRGVRHPLELEIDPRVLLERLHDRPVGVRGGRGVEHRHPGQGVVRAPRCSAARAAAGGEGARTGNTGGRRGEGLEKSSALNHEWSFRRRKWRYCGEFWSPANIHCAASYDAVYSAMTSSMPWLRCSSTTASKPAMSIWPTMYSL